MSRKGILVSFFVVVYFFLASEAVYAASKIPNQALDLRGNAYYDSAQGIYVLTEEETWQSGAIWFSQVKCNDNFSIVLDFYTGHANHDDPCGGADGICVAFYADSSKTGDQGEGLGFEGCGGYGVEIDTYENWTRNDPAYNHIAIIKDSVSNHLCIADATAFTEDGSWHHLQIVNHSGICTIYVDGTQILIKDNIAPNGQYEIGITAATGDGCNFHAVRNIELLEADWIDSESTVEKGKYCIHVVDENGNPLKGTLVKYDGKEELTDVNGNANFNLFTVGTPVIEVSLDGYITVDNRNSNWSKNANRYETVVLYPNSYGVYKLKSARYSNSGSMSNSTDLLTATKKLNLKNEGHFVGDLDFGNFYLTCAALDSSGVDHYELWQGEKKITESQDGNFGKLSVTSFSKGGSCFIRVVSSDGRKVDTSINLEFANNDVVKETSISFKTDKFSFKIDDDIPIIGGSNISLKIPDTFPLTVVASESKLQIGVNYKSDRLSGESKTQQQRYDDFKKTIDSFQKACSFGSMSWSDQNHFLSFLQDQNKIEGLSDGWKKREVYFGGYIEGDWGSQKLTLKGVFLVKLSILDIKKNGVAFFGVVPVPWTAHLKLNGEGSISPELVYEINSSTLKGDLDLEVKPGLEVFGGVGFDEYLSGGAYGSAKLDVLYRLLALSNATGLQKIDMTGEFGIKAYVAKHSWERPFAHQTWHLYTANAVTAASLMEIGDMWNEGLYDALQYQVDNLSYLSEESDWMGDSGVRLMNAEAKTEFSALLTDTYRNAQPVMVSSGNALYAAFVRADQATDARYVVVTKYNGTNWAAPIQADADAILDSIPRICVDSGGVIWLAYARTTTDPCDSLLEYAKNQEIVIGKVDPDTLTFTESAAFSGNYTCLQKLDIIDGQPVLAWVDATITDDSSVLHPDSGTICHATYSSGAWSEASIIANVDVPIDSLTIGALNGSLAIAYTSDDTLYQVTTTGSTVLATDVAGRVCYGTLPGSDNAAFIWNGEGVLTSSSGESVEVEGITHEYVIVGNNVYYSTVTDESANLAVLQYDNGNWGLPIQLTDENRYLENLSAARLNGQDYILGMHTAVTITEDSVEDAKNLVWSAVMPVSDLRLDDISYDDDALSAGDAIPVTLTVTNSGDHTVSSIGVSLDGTAVKTESCYLLPGQSIEIETSLICPDTLTTYTYSVSETGWDDYTPDNNTVQVEVGYADVETELVYQQIGAQKTLLAYVTNIGIETASGSVVFYDANDTAVAESSFEQLASGDTAIIAYDLPQDFNGINGGDVSVSVTLGQEELYTYNNSASYYIMETNDASSTSARVISVSANGTTIIAEIDCTENTSLTTYCAFYSTTGRMLHVESKPLEAGKTNTPSFSYNGTDAAYAKIFVLNASYIPMCVAEQVSL